MTTKNDNKNHVYYTKLKMTKVFKYCTFADDKV